MLKQRYPATAFYLPPQHQLTFRSTETPGSTGETLYAQLNEIFRAGTAPLLLLDEWDANLDPATQSKVSALIDQLANQATVCEVRHH